MTSLQKLLYTLCSGLSCVIIAEGVIHVFGYVGKYVKVPCPYGQGYESHEKYLCKNDCGNADVLITTSDSNKTKYSIFDDKETRTVTTTISDLHSGDAGKYWCGVTRNGIDIYTEVKLTTEQDSCCDDVKKTQSHEGHAASLSCPYESQYGKSLKYLCRGNQPSACLQQAVITSYSPQNGRFTLTDDATSSFTVNISGLTVGDSGQYLCGVHRDTQLDVFSAVHLEVREWCCVESKNVSSPVGGRVTLECPYPPEHRRNRKFLCKGDQRRVCSDVTDGGRFRLHNESSSSFSVTVSELEAADAGTYWCGSDPGWSLGNYTRIRLSVDEINSAKPADTHLFVVIGFVAGLLLMLCVLFTVYKHKCCRVKGSEDGADMNELKAVDTRSMTGTEDIYENNADAAKRLETNFSIQQSARHQADNDYVDEPDYENFSNEEELYCNQSYRHTSMK
ncbi:polymeric immunoglobulin receptor-like isoform 2-T2 [Menidia menidia]